MRPAMTNSRGAVRLVIFDLDGVVYRGVTPVPGVATAIRQLGQMGIAACFATNNSTVDRDAYVARLAAMGIAATREEIVTSTSATVEHLARHAPHVRRVLAVGSAAMVSELRDAGFVVTPAEEAAPEAYDGDALDATYHAVVVGLDLALTYRRLAAATTALRDGASFFATNADERYPTAVGFLPGAGSVVAALRTASGIEPRVIGKPEPAMFQAILDSTGVDARAALVVGDNPASDIVAARRAGIRSVLVLTGVADAATAATLGGERRPDILLPTAAELPGLLRGELLSS